MTVDEKYEAGKKIIHIGDSDEPCVEIYEANNGCWIKSEVEWKTGYSRQYSLESASHGLTYNVPQSEGKDSVGNVFLSHDHVMLIDETPDKTTLHDLDEEPKHISEDLDEIMEAVMEEIHELFEKQLDFIKEFDVAQENPGQSPVETLMETQSDVIKKAKRDLTDHISKGLQQKISESFIDSEVPTITGFYLKCNPESNNRHTLRCLTYDLEVWAKYDRDPTAPEDKPEVKCTDARLDEYPGEVRLVGRFWGHPKLANGEAALSSPLLHLRSHTGEDGVHYSIIESKNTMFMVQEGDWNTDFSNQEQIRRKLRTQDANYGDPEPDRCCISESCHISFTNIPEPNASDKWFWQKLISSLGDSSKYKLMDASQQHPTELSGWMLKEADIEGLGVEFEGFVNYLKAEYF